MSIGARKPPFIVLANLLAVFCLAGVCLKLLTRYLPESQPNRLSMEYGSYVRQSMRQAIDWRPFEPSAFEYAKANDKLIFVEFGTSFSRFSNILTKFHFNEPELSRLLNNHFVSIRVDLSEQPWLREQFSLNSARDFQSEGCFLLVLTPSGEIIQETSFMPLFSQGRTVGLIDWLSEIALEWVGSRAEVRARAAKIAQERSSRVELGGGQATIRREDPLHFGEQLSGAMRTPHGGFLDMPTPICPQIPALLAESEIGRHREAARSYLLGLRASQAYDQINGGIFFATSKPGWGDPHTGKQTMANALMAVEFARASQSKNDLFSRTCRDIVSWIVRFQRDASSRLFMAGSESDEHPVTGSEFFGWTESELREAESQYFEAGSDSSVASPPYADLPLDYESANQRIASVLREAERLRNVRRVRTPPPNDTGVYADVNGALISALYRIATVLDDAQLLLEADEAYERARAMFVQPLGDCLHAPRGIARSTGYSGDYLWMARAAIDRFSATSDDNALQDAILIMGRHKELFDKRGVFGLVLQSQVQFCGFALPVVPFADSPLENINALAARNWHDLSLITGSSAHRQTSLAVLNGLRAKLEGIGWQSVGFVRAIAMSFRPAVVLNRLEPSLTRSLQRRHPYRQIFPSSVPSVTWDQLPPGVYVVREGTVTGPMGEQDAMALLSNLVG